MVVLCRLSIQKRYANFVLMNKYKRYIYLVCLAFGYSILCDAQSLEYHHICNGVKCMQADLPLLFSIIQNNHEVVYKERQTIHTDSSGSYFVLIGSGIPKSGSFKDIIWSDGDYTLSILPDTTFDGIDSYAENFTIRKATDLNRPHVEGTFEETGKTGDGQCIIPNPHGRRPMKITIDLSTSYVNVDYPAGKYPVYRHFEWFDDNRDGNGNTFNLTFSEKTNHAIFKQTKKIGEVKLFPKAFQEFVITNLDDKIVINISKPEIIKYFNQTYAIKGPWKMIYYIEWDY